MAALQELEDRIRGLEARLEEVEAVQEIQRLKAHYGALVDARLERGVDDARREALAAQISELFTEDAVWDGGEGLGLCEGREAIRERMRNSTLLFTWHYFLKPQIRVEGDRARGTWDILAPCTGQDGTPLWMAGVEEDEYARVQGRWLHTRMNLRVVFMCPYERGWARRK
jgi:hypothetical protein